MAKKKVLAVRGFLMHVTHYDPVWCKRKAREKPFELEVALELVDAMADAGLNLLVVDCGDGVRYRSHPETARRYTVPMRQLRKLADRAGRRGIEFVPKLNFSRSPYHHHNDWMRPHAAPYGRGDWSTAFEFIDELIGVCRPRRFFHVGMDEDHDRSHEQYSAAVRELRKGLKQRKLRTVIWNDSMLSWAGGQVYAEKCRCAEPKIPRDVVHVLWNYSGTNRKVLRRVIGEGFDVWGAPGRDPDKVRECRDALLSLGGAGILLTRWAPCRRGNRAALLRLIRELGPLCHDTGGGR